jgi:hypothetical protein
LAARLTPLRQRVVCGFAGLSVVCAAARGRYQANVRDQPTTESTNRGSSVPSMLTTRGSAQTTDNAAEPQITREAQ